MIEAVNLTKNYGRLEAVKDVSFRAEKGEILGFLGPNGAGKTTTMRILACFMPPTSGRAVVAGFDCFTHPMEVKRRVGYLPESAPLYGDMKVGEFLDFAGGAKGMRGDRKKTKVGEAMEATGVRNVAGRLIGKLSRGYRQRVGIAQALLNDPEILILDEPTAGLDPAQIVEIRNLIKNLSGERTVIISTHILPEASLVCDRVVIISGGRVVAEDTPQNLAAQRREKGAIHLLVAGNPGEVREFVASLPGVLKVEEDGIPSGGEVSLLVGTEPERDLRREIASAIVGRGFGLLEIRRKQVSLEDVFVNLVTEETGGKGDETSGV